MKRAISYILVLLMLISSMGISAIAADPSKANTAATSVTGSDKVGLSAAITAAKNKFSVPAEYKNFSYSVNDQGNEKVWQLNWSSVDGGSVNMSIDDAGRLRNYSRYDPTYNYSNKIKAPLITRTEAQKIAETTLSKVAPEISGHFKENTSNSYYYTGSYTYSFSYYRIENNIPLTSNTVSIEINFLTKQVTSLYVNWNYDLKFPAPEGAISLKDAQEILKKALHVSLEYRIQNDTGSDDAVKAVLVYNNVDGYKSVDPFTGKVYDQNYDWSNGKDDVSKMRGGMGGNTADSKIDGFTEEELQKISESEKLLTADDADKIIRTNKLLAIDDSYTLTSKSLNSAYRKTSDGNSSYLWYFYYTGKIVKNNFAAPSAYAAVDAKTGEILSFSSYNINDSSGKVSYNETSAKKIADQFLTANSGEKFKNTVKDDESPIIYPEYDSAKQPTSFSFYYARTYNGVKLPADYLNATVNAFTGKITNFYSNWHHNITFESIEGIILSSAAIDKMLEQCGFALQYELFTTYYYDIDSSSKDTNSLKETVITYPGSIIPSQISVRLVYIPDYQSRPLTVSARTGELVNYNGQPYEESTQKLLYNDISNHWIKNQAEILAGIGIGFDGGSLYPNKNILQKEFLYLLSKTMQIYLPFNKMSALSDQNDLDNLYKQMENMGIIKKAEEKPNAIVTKLDAVKFIIRAAGYEKAAQVKGIFITPFNDNASLSAADKGYFALAYGLGIIKGEANKALPKKVLNRAESLSIIYNYLKV